MDRSGSKSTSHQSEDGADWSAYICGKVVVVWSATLIDNLTHQLDLVRYLTTIPFIDLRAWPDKVIFGDCVGAKSSPLFLVHTSGFINQ